MTLQQARMRGVQRAPVPGRLPRLSPAADLPSIEHEVLRRWHERDVFGRSLAMTSDGPVWTCAGDPPATGGLPGIQHLPGLAVRDLYQRYKAMRGYLVPRPLAWNCHGLDVEVAVERELGLCGRADIERYGVGRFATRCRESAMRHLRAHSALMERIGHWGNLAGALRTMDPGYVESVWACVYRLFTAGLLVRDERIVPYCPRCQTNLADHELARPASSRTVADDAVTVRFPITETPEQMTSWLSGAHLLAGSIAPWTLAANAAIAVHPHQTYAVARRAGEGERVVIAEAAVGRVLGEGWHVVARFSGAEIAGVGYLPPFGPASGHQVLTGRFVNVEAGTGLVHLAPDFGTDDLDACLAKGITPVSPVEADGRFRADLPLVGGVFFLAAGQTLTDMLADKGLLFSAERTARSRLHCWRCAAPLLPRLQPTWFVRTSAATEQLLAQDRLTTWVPAPAKPGTDGGWLHCETDWALSRSRYWGTPLPIWQCERGHLTCVPSRARLSDLAGRDVTAIDPHRPAIDEVTIACPACAESARRVPEVIDSAFDAGAMPFAMVDQADRGGKGDDSEHPAWLRAQADLATETADEGGGWLYALMTARALLTGQPAFRTALCLGSVLDDDGTAMSRGRGNVADPLPLIDEFGADALRWLITADGSPSAARVVTDAALADVVGNVLLAYRDCVASFAAQAGSARAEPAPPASARPAIDRWVLSETQSLVADVTAALDSVHSAAAGRRIAGFIGELCHWYLPAFRRRFAEEEAVGDRPAALATLQGCLDVLTRLMAPIAPFLTDFAWDAIRADDAPDSVHLARWPVPVESLADQRLADRMTLARRITELGRAARVAAAITACQPLARALLSDRAFDDLGDELIPLVARELNVRAVGLLSSADAATDEHAPTGWAAATDDGETVALDLQITPELHREGLARTVINLVTQARDADGVGVAQQIALRWLASGGELNAVLTEYGPLIRAGVLAADYGRHPAAGGSGPANEAGAHEDTELGLRFWIRPLD